MESWVTWIIQAAIMLGVGAIGFFLKQTVTQIRAEIEKQAKRVDALEIKLNDTIATMPYNYTLRDDFIRAVAGIDKKLDKIYDGIIENRKSEEARHG